MNPVPGDPAPEVDPAPVPMARVYSPRPDGPAPRPRTTPLREPGPLRPGEKAAAADAIKVFLKSRAALAEGGLVDLSLLYLVVDFYVEREDQASRSF